MSMNRPSIPTAEYPKRWKKVQEMMREKKLDLLIAYADDRATYGAAHARWLGNLPVHFEPVCVMVSPRGRPVLLCGPETDEYARLVGAIPDVRVLREFTHPDEDYPFSKIEGLSEIVAGVAGKPKAIRRVGLAGKALMNGDVLAAFKAALPSASWVDAENAVLSLRAIKTPAEIAVIRYAYKVAEAGINAAIRAVKPGVMERDIAAEAEYAMRRMGSEGMGIDTIVASGMRTRPILARTTMNRVGKNDLVLITIAPRYEGYHAAIARPVLVGKPRPEAVKATHAANRAQAACFEALGPGVEGRIVEGVGRGIMTEAGFGDNFLYSGIHSVGVIEFEAPIFGPSARGVIEPGMVLSIDIPVFNSRWGGLRVEDGFLITRTGVERMNRTAYVVER